MKKTNSNIKFKAFVFVLVIGIFFLVVGFLHALYGEGALGKKHKVSKPFRKKAVKSSSLKKTFKNKKNVKIQKYFSLKRKSVKSYTKRTNEKIAPKSRYNEKPMNLGVEKPSPSKGYTLQKRFRKKGKVAIIIDDFGYTWNNVEEFCSLPIPVTFAILPHTPYAGKVSWKARKCGKEVILHLPLENKSGINPGRGTITTDMSKEEVRKVFLEDLLQVPGAVGFNNHEGSKATEDPSLMDEIMKVAKEKGLFFIDSRTSSQSVAYDTAKRYGVSCGKRNVFLDNEDKVEYIYNQIQELIDKAKKDGYAIGIGHCRRNTYLALKKIAEEERNDVEFVFASQVVE